MFTNVQILVYMKVYFYSANDVSYVFEYFEDATAISGQVLLGVFQSQVEYLGIH